MFCNLYVSSYLLYCIIYSLQNRQVDRLVMVPLISWNLHWPDAHGSLQLSSQEKTELDGGSTAHTGVVLVFFFFNHEYPSWTHLAFHLFTKVINWSKSARLDFSTGTSFSKFWPIFVWLDRVTHTIKCRSNRRRKAKGKKRAGEIDIG